MTQPATTGYMARPAIAPYRLLPMPELIERYRSASSLIERRVLELTAEQADTFFRPESEVGRWSCRVLLGHLADADLAEVHRMRKTAAEDRPTISPWDENAFIDEGLYGPRQPIAGFVAVIHTLRLWSGEWLATLTPEQMARKALHPEKGELSIHEMLIFSTWHFEHHIDFLKRKLIKLLGPAPLI